MNNDFEKQLEALQNATPTKTKRVKKVDAFVEHCLKQGKSTTYHSLSLISQAAGGKKSWPDGKNWLDLNYNVNVMGMITKNGTIADSGTLNKLKALGIQTSELTELSAVELIAEVKEFTKKLTKKK